MPAKKAEVKQQGTPEQKVRIKISAYDHKVIDSSAKQIIDTVVRQGCEAIGPIPLPTNFRRYTVNRSSFVHKDAREQFEMRTHRRVIDIVNPNAKVIEALSNLTLPAGVDIEIRM